MLGKGCCSYGQQATRTSARGFDCVHIPGAVSNGASPQPVGSNICGNNSGLRAGNQPNGSVCSARAPFNINFRSDRFEVVMETALGQAGNKGFLLQYAMDSTGCTASATTG